MNVVGKVGSLITQGVYSVATPFHPFGGAVDIIVVQQQDGSFRSTPWYVQFGKFQGVLKGAEKVVRIKVNGVEANFHMNLDNSGEAYFVREADSSESSEKSPVLKDEREGTPEYSFSIDNSQCNINNDNVENFRLQSTLSDPGMLREEYSSFNRLERNDSDACRFYDFQDDQSFDDPVDLASEYGSSRYDTMDAVENFVEAQGSDSEMVLVSVDGHILTAPILSSEHDTENVPLDTPQFHLGPGKGNGFCEEERRFTLSENTWDTEYLNDLDVSSSKPISVVTSLGDNSSLPLESVGHTVVIEEHECHDQGRDEDGIRQSELCHDEGTDNMHGLRSLKKDAELVDGMITYEVFRKTDYQGEETGDMNEFKAPEGGKYLHENGGVEDMNLHEAQDGDTKFSCQDEIDKNVKHQGRGIPVLSDIGDASPSAKNEDKFRSCLDLTKEAVDESSSEGSPLGARDKPEFIEEKSSQNIQESNKAEKLCSPETSGDDGSVTIIKSQGVMEAETDENSSRSALDFIEVRESEERVHQSKTNDSEFAPNDNALVCENESVTPNLSVKRDIFPTEGNLSETISDRYEEPHTNSSSEQAGGNVNSTLEISLCRHLLRSGMGLSAADEVFNAYRLSENEFKNTASSVLKNENLVIRYKGKYLPWDQAAPIVLGMAAFGLHFSMETKNAIPVEQEVTSNLGVNDSGSASGRRWRLWPNPFRRVKTLERSTSTNSEDIFVDSESVSQSPSIDRSPTSQTGTLLSATSGKSPHKKIVRTNIPTNEQISSLNLKEGQNDVTFSFSTRVLGLQQVEAHIYLWKWNARIVISDVDGTITRSDVLGQFMPLVGKDWSQSGVARLFSAIKENGYQLLFLSARAIVQAYLTKSFLFNLKQDGKTLPSGPVVISPNGLFPSLFREVIRRAPHEFKIACLEDIKALFPPDYNPFYAGFGNRDTDELTYRKLGIPKGKIFIINPKGEVAINHRIDVKSYTSLHTLVHDMFPPTSMVEQEDYNSWNYWRMPMPDIDDYHLEHCIWKVAQGYKSV